jgi:ankyrin repeat protein
MKYIKLFENFDPYDPYDLMIIPSNKKAKMIMDEYQLKIARMLVDSGADLNIQDTWGNTPLHWAAKNGSEYLEIVKLLVDAGARTDIQANNGKTFTSLQQLKK